MSGRVVLILASVALFVLGHAILIPQGALARLFGGVALGGFEPVRPLVGLLAFALGAVSLLAGLQPKKRPLPEDINTSLQSAQPAPKPVVVTEPPGAPLAPFPAEAALQTGPAALVAAAVAPAAAPTAAPDPAPSAPPVEIPAIAMATTPDPVLKDTPQAVAASLREALAAPAGESRRTQLRKLSEQVAALAASLAALADEKREAKEELPTEQPMAVAQIEPEPPPEIETPPVCDEVIEAARAEFQAAPFSLAAKSALAAALETSSRAEDLEEALDLRRQVARVSVSQGARLDLAGAVEKLASARAAAGDTAGAKSLLSESLADLSPMVAQDTRYADLVHDAKVAMARLS